MAKPPSLATLAKNLNWKLVSDHRMECTAPDGVTEVITLEIPTGLAKWLPKIHVRERWIEDARPHIVLQANGDIPEHRWVYSEDNNADAERSLPGQILIRTLERDLYRHPGFTPLPLDENNRNEFVTRNWLYQASPGEEPTPVSVLPDRYPSLVLFWCFGPAEPAIPIVASPHILQTLFEKRAKIQMCATWAETEGLLLQQYLKDRGIPSEITKCVQNHDHALIHTVLSIEIGNHARLELAPATHARILLSFQILPFDQHQYIIDQAKHVLAQIEEFKNWRRDPPALSVHNRPVELACDFPLA